MSPYGQSIFADAIDAVQAVDVAFDAMTTEVDITDAFQEKKQDLSEVGVTMTVAELRTKWYGEAPDVAEERAGKLGA